MNSELNPPTAACGKPPMGHAWRKRTPYFESCTRIFDYRVWLEEINSLAAVPSVKATRLVVVVIIAIAVSKVRRNSSGAVWKVGVDLIIRGGCIRRCTHGVRSVLRCSIFNTKCGCCDYQRTEKPGDAPPCDHLAYGSRRILANAKRDRARHDVKA